eukprot:PITA_35036
MQYKSTYLRSLYSHTALKTHIQDLCTDSMLHSMVTLFNTENHAFKTQTLFMPNVMQTACHSVPQRATIMQTKRYVNQMLFKPNVMQTACHNVQFTLGSGPITWACKKQGAISLSSAEAEYRGAVEASKATLWLRQILLEFRFQQQHPTTLWCDNQSAIQLCKDPVQHQRSKHIELHMHFIRKPIHDHVLEVQYCSTDDQVADIFTKALIEAKFTKLRFMVGVQEVVTKGG